MTTPDRETRHREIDATPRDAGDFTRAKLTVFGEEMIEKEVRPRLNIGRVYLPPDWVGKLVKVIRID
jgi:hypothetical protein